jgi:ParB/RepB/Spo0J family partition protein
VKYEALVAEVRDQGFVSPILVRPVGGNRFQLIDGEHRWRVVSDLGRETILSVIIDEDDEDEARIRALAMNGLRGKPNALKQAYLLADLVKRIPEATLRERLGMKAGEMEDRLRMAELDKGLGDRLKARSAPKRIGSKKIFRVTVSAEDHETIERVVEALQDGKMDRGEALAHACREFERTRS